MQYDIYIYTYNMYFLYTVMVQCNISNYIYLYVHKMFKSTLVRSHIYIYIFIYLFICML